MVLEQAQEERERAEQEAATARDAVAAAHDAGLRLVAAQVRLRTPRFLKFPSPLPFPLPACMRAPSLQGRSVPDPSAMQGLLWCSPHQASKFVSVLNAHRYSMHHPLCVVG